MRTKPYTETGIKRVPCTKCGKPSSQQWQICSLFNAYKGLCIECDVKLNDLVLKFMGIPAKDRYSLIEDYRLNLLKKEHNGE